MGIMDDPRQFEIASRPLFPAKIYLAKIRKTAWFRDVLWAPNISASQESERD
jgi:hypothetical protein